MGSAAMRKADEEESDEFSSFQTECPLVAKYRVA